jgi:hypothetical protein
MGPTSLSTNVAHNFERFFGLATATQRPTYIQSLVGVHQIGRLLLEWLYYNSYVHTRFGLYLRQASSGLLEIKINQPRHKWTRHQQLKSQEIQTAGKGLGRLRPLIFGFAAKGRAQQTKRREKQASKAMHTQATHSFIHICRARPWLQIKPLMKASP